MTNPSKDVVRAVRAYRQLAPDLTFTPVPVRLKRHIAGVRGLTVDQRSDLLEAYQNGDSVRALVARFEVSKTSILRHLHANDVVVRPRGGFYKQHR